MWKGWMPWFQTGLRCQHRRIQSKGGRAAWARPTVSRTGSRNSLEIVPCLRIVGAVPRLVRCVIGDWIFFCFRLKARAEVGAKLGRCCMLSHLVLVVYVSYTFAKNFSSPSISGVHTTPLPCGNPSNTFFTVLENNQHKNVSPRPFHRTPHSSLASRTPQNNTRAPLPVARPVEGKTLAKQRG